MSASRSRDERIALYADKRASGEVRSMSLWSAMSARRVAGIVRVQFVRHSFSTSRWCRGQVETNAYTSH